MDVCGLMHVKSLPCHLQKCLNGSFQLVDLLSTRHRPHAGPVHLAAQICLFKKGVN